MKPTLKKVSKYENKFAKLQKKAAEFNFRNQLKQVKKKEFTLEEEDKEVRTIVIDRIRLEDVTFFDEDFFSARQISTQAFFGFIKMKRTLQKYKSKFLYFHNFFYLIHITFITFAVIFISNLSSPRYISAIWISIDKFVDNFWVLQWDAYFLWQRDG